MMGTNRTARRLAAAISATSLLVTLAVGLGAPAASGDPAHLSSDQQRRAHGAALAPARPSTSVVSSVAQVAAATVPAPVMRAARPTAVRWPEPSTTTLDVTSQGAAPGSSTSRTAGPPVRLALVDEPRKPGKSPARRARVRVMGRAATQEAGIDGLLLRVDPVGAPAGAAPIDVAVDYSSFAGAYGGDWASRLRLVRLPSCALTTPELEQCRTQTPVASTNDPATSTVSAALAPASMGVMALAAGTSGSTGNWSATSLSPSAAWQVSAQTGDFTWSYPMRVPPASGGPAPELALSYSSGSLDGKVASTNNQTSWVGDGWDLTTGYVERSYVPCYQDADGDANNTDHKTGDLCWSSDNATLVFGGKASELVKDQDNGTWRLKEDDGTRVERMTGSGSADNNGEYWKVTTTNGTEYFFGREKRSSTDVVDLGSAWTVPVYGNNPGEPCYDSTFADSWCTQAWRWNLEYVVDTSDNTMSYFYEKERNNYGRNLGQKVTGYVRGGYLAAINYGERAQTQELQSPPAQVDFTVAERCLPSGTITCATDQLTEDNATSWPDVPFDLICTSDTSCPTQTSPAFFTRKRLIKVTTSVSSGSGYQTVDSWDLKQTFPASGDGTNATLWLSSIAHKGVVGAAVLLPDVRFSGTPMDNRVDKLGDAGPPMTRYRLTGIESESGGVTSVGYSDVDCTSADLPAAPSTNTRRCFPVMWTPEGADQPIREYFHKYLVDVVVAAPGTGQGRATTTRYSYRGDAAWHYDDNPLVPAKQRTWGQFRGYGAVDVMTGASDEPQRTATRYRYFRGMDGDHLPGGATRNVDVDNIADKDRLNGFLREQITYNGVDGPEVSGVVNTPWVSRPLAIGADGTTATRLDVGVTAGRVAASSLPGGQRTTRTETTFDDVTGVATQLDDQGDTATAADDRCTTIQYAQNLDANIIGTVKHSETVAVNCAATPSRPGDVIADSRIFYDGGGFGAEPTRGLATTTQRLSAYSAGAPQYVTESTIAYDAQGRATRVTDALGRTTTTAYTPAAGGPVTSTKVTAPDPDGTGKATAAVTITDVNPAWGLPIKVSDPNSKVTTATYDALGRTTSVWLPGRAQGVKTANITYAYGVSSVGKNWVTTKTLTAGETYLTSVAFFDGLLRPRQTQVPSATRDTVVRVVTDTFYDTRGLVDYTNGAWPTAGSPETTLMLPTSVLPSSTRYAYDGAGRVTAEILDVEQVEHSRTTTSYGGDRVSIDPPAGAVPQTTITDARGQTSQLRQYTGTSPTGAYQATNYAYTPAGNLAQVSDAAGNRWTYSYDLRGRQIAATDPDKGASSTTYDAGGQVTATTNPLGTLAYTRDQLGRTTAVRDNTATGALRATWTYDSLAKGQLTSSTRYKGTSQYVTAVTGYDDGYRPLGQSVTIPAAEGALAGTYTTGYSYTVDGQVSATRLPAAGGLYAETVSTYYDELSKPEWMSGGLGNGVYVAASVYAETGQPVQYDLGNTYAQFVNYDYEKGTNRLKRAWLVRENVTGNDLNLNYTYDQAGNPTSIVDRPTGKPVDAQCFGYDGMRRLTRAWTPASANCATTPTTAGLGGPAPYWTDDTFDAVGNRTKQVSYATAGTTTRTYTYPAAGAARPHGLTAVTQVAPGAVTTTNKYAFDATGNTRVRALSGKAAQTLAWDSEGELSSVSLSTGAIGTYTYTADGDRLVRTQNGQTTVYLPGGMELTLTKATGVKTATRYYTFNGATIAVRTATGGAGVTSLISDPHATAEVAVANTTNVLTRRRLDPYGNARGTAPLWKGDHGYLNKPTDTTGLTQIGARYYDPTMGRFISVDPVMVMTDPQSWQGYAYSSNNPITYSDPTGLRLSEKNNPKDDSTGVLSDQGRAKKRSSATPPPSVDPPIRQPQLFDDFGSTLVDALQSYAVGAANGTVSLLPNLVITLVNYAGPAQVGGLFGWHGFKYWGGPWENPNKDNNSYNWSFGIGEVVGPQIALGGGLGAGTKAAVGAGRVGELGVLVDGAAAATAEASVATEGIYVVQAEAGTYVGQSGSIAERLAQHVRTGKFTQAEADAAERICVPGGKTSREVAEQLKLDELGGKRGPGILNKVNPIGDRRLDLMPDWYSR